MRIRHMTGSDVFAMAALALFFFVFLGSEYFFDVTMGTMVDSATGVLDQGLILGSSVIGFLLFSVLDRRIGYRYLASALVSAVLFIVCIVIVGLAFDARTTLFAGCLAFMVLGVAGGSAHWAFSERLSGSPYLARLVAVSYACGLLIQFFNNNLAASPVIEVVVLCIGGMGLFICLRVANGGSLPRFIGAAVNHGASASTSEEPPIVSDSLLVAVARAERPTRVAICLIVTVVLMTGLFGTLDNIITLANARGDVNVAAWPRLFLLGGALIAGWLFDIRGRRYMPLITFCIAMLSTIAVIVLEGGGSMLVCTLVFYVSSGFYVVFFTTSFFVIAPRMRHPRIWAGMGRIVNNATAIAIAVPSLMLVASANTTTIIAVDLVLFAGIAVVLFFSGSLNADNAEFAFGQDNEDEPMGFGEASGLAAVASFDRRLQAITDECHLTARENEVLKAVISSEQPIKQIAADMEISPRMVQRHLTSLYHKTGTQTRAGLISRFYGGSQSS